MDYSIGKIIRKVRKEKNLTQEELAEQLYVTSQAVSKWENETSLPDISQIVPLCRVLEISADELFGILGTNADEEVERFLKETEEYSNSKVEEEEKYDNVYKMCLEQLKLYPNNTKLLVYTIGYAYHYAHKYRRMGKLKEAKDAFDEIKREANLIIQYGKNIHDIMTAHMWLVKIYCEFQMFDEAKKEALFFPKDTDYTEGSQLAWVYWCEKNNDSEIKTRCENLANILTSLSHELIMLGNAYKRKGQYNEAIGTYEAFIKTVDAIYGSNKISPPLHTWYWIYMHIAHCYLELGDSEKAIDCLYEEYNRFTDARERYNVKFDFDTVPALKECDFPHSTERLSIKKPLLSSLDKKWFDSIRKHPRFIALTDKVNALEY